MRDESPEPFKQVIHLLHDISFMQFKGMNHLLMQNVTGNLQLDDLKEIGLSAKQVIHTFPNSK